MSGAAAMDVMIVVLIFVCTAIGYQLGKYNQRNEDEMRDAIRRRNQSVINNNNRRK